MKPDYKLLSGSTDMYGIYRMKDTKENEEYKQQGELHPFHENHKVFRENYELIYVGDIHAPTTCEELVNEIRKNPPEGFPDKGTEDGHVLVLSQGGKLEFYYSEIHGAIPIEDFAKDFSLPKERYNNMTEENILSTVLATAHAAFDELNSYDLDYGLRVVGAKIYGSRENGNYKSDSDIDVLLEYEGDLKESEVFNIVNEAGISIAGMKLDINPIRAEESGTIEEFLERDKVRKVKLEEIELPFPGEPRPIKNRVFFDMDGTATVFQPVDKIETLYEKGYFLNLSPNMTVIDAIRDLCYDSDYEVYIMSSVLSDSQYALEEKNAWLDKYLPEINVEHRIFPHCGKNKLEYIPDGVRPSDCLVDDYTTNLVQWEPPAKGIKLLNGINHTNRTWTGNMVSFSSSGEDIANKIRKIVDGAFIQDVRPQDMRINVAPDLDADIRELKDGVKEIHSLIKSVVPNFGIEQPVIAEKRKRADVFYYTKKSAPISLVEPQIMLSPAMNKFFAEAEDLQELGVMINGVPNTLTYYDRVTSTYMIPSLYEIDMTEMSEEQKEFLLDDVNALASFIHRENAYMKASDVLDVVSIAARKEIRGNKSEWGYWPGRLSTEENPQNYIDISVTGYTEKHQLMYEVEVVRENEIVDTIQHFVKLDPDRIEESVVIASREGCALIREELRAAIKEMDTDLTYGLKVYSPYYGDHGLKEHHEALEKKGYVLPAQKMQFSRKVENVRPINAPQPKKPRL